MTTQQVWKKYHKDIKTFIVSKVKHEQVANDLLQETFIKIHTKLDTLQQTNKIKSWVFSIARNTVFDFWRTNTFSSEFVDDNHLIEEDTLIHDEKDCLHGILKTLPKKFRDPLFLSDIKGMKQKEVAVQLKLNLSTTKSRIQRARKLIAQGYVKCCDFKINKKGFLVGEIKEREDCKVCS